MIIHPSENELDYIIELSLLKIRRLQIMGPKDERQRLLIIDTLQKGIINKVKLLEVNGCLEMDRSSAFVAILHDAMRKLGLVRVLRLNMSTPDSSDEFPTLKVANGRKSKGLPSLAIDDYLAVQKEQIIEMNVVDD